MQSSLSAVNEMIQKESTFVDAIRSEIAKVIVGQDAAVDRILVAILCGGHVLLEGVPGLAKTLMIKTFADCVAADFKRIQFTPDLLPADLTGTMIYNPKTQEFTPRFGPIFAHIVLGDEINRAPAKVQSALLEAMQERQVTIGDKTYLLPKLFMVMATQNPIEQKGTYPLPEAQIDRFMLKLKIDYPGRSEEKEIMERMAGGAEPKAKRIVTVDDVLRARGIAAQVYMDEKLKDYIVSVVLATRKPAEFGLRDMVRQVEWGASPRATIFLAMASRAHAFVKRRGFVTPEDIKAIGMDVLRHRIILTYEAEAEDVKAEDVVKRVFDAVEVP